MTTESINQYLEYIKNELKTIDRSQAKASYNTGYGLHIVTEKLGQSAFILDVVASSIVKIRPPNIDDYEEWTIAWNEAKRLVKEFLKNK